jgi:hypothetical protein
MLSEQILVDSLDRDVPAAGMHDHQGCPTVAVNFECDLIVTHR